MADFIPERPASRPRRPPPPPERMAADHIGVLIGAAGLMIVGWGGLYLLISTSKPRIGAELWAFFVLLQLGVTGATIPLVRYLNVRLTLAQDEPAPGGVIIRQSVWIGLFVVLCAWLQILRALSAPIGFFLALVFVVLEVFLRSREKSVNG